MTMNISIKTTLSAFTLLFALSQNVYAQTHKTTAMTNTKASHPITVNLYYTGKNGSARKFVEEMENSGIADSIRKEPGNIRYDYFVSMSAPETVLLIDSWSSQEAIDAHHTSPMMKSLAQLRDKYDLHMKAERYIKEDELPAKDDKFIRH